MKITLPLIILFILTGCSNRGIYEGIEISNRHECSKVPPAHYDDCIKKTTKSYDEYERERKKI